MRMIPIFDVRFWGNEKKYLNKCLKIKWISSQGEYVTKFEKLFAQIHKSKFCLAVSNCTVGLHLALEALGIKKDDEVLCPNLTWISPANMISLSGAKLVLVDIDETWNINPLKIEEKITKKTKCIMVVHLFGHPANMDPIVKIAKKYKLKIIEDVAESIGAKYKKKLVGTFGDASCFSFFSNKVFTSGEGGAILFKNKKIFNKASILRDHGMSKKVKYRQIVRGFNYRITNLQAAVLLAQIEKFKKVLSLRNLLFNKYKESLKKINNINLMPSKNWAEPVMWLMTIVLAKNINRKSFINKMKKKNIECRPMINLVSEANHFKKLNFSSSKKSIYLSRQSVHLPSSSNLTNAKIQYICNSLAKIISKKC